MKLTSMVQMIGMGLALGSTVQLAVAGEGGQKKRVPLVHGTDLFHPHDDPDDHFDLATVFAIEEFDVKAILLDLGSKQRQKPGRIPVEQMLKITGRQVPYAAGLSHKLKSPDDKALDQPKEDQGAVELLLKVLRESPEPVMINLAGSTRDVCAAFNRDPQLLRDKVARLYLNIGSMLQDQSERAGEWNELLDPQAYIGVMRSGLPVYWCPCRPTKENRSSHWAFKHGEVLEGVPPALLNWFIYALQVVRPEEIDPMAAMSMDLRPWRHILMGMERSMWCTGGLIHASGRTIYRVGDHWVAAASPPPEGKPAEVFTFVPVNVEIQDINGRAFTKWTESAAQPNMHMYKVTDPKNHQAGLKSCLHDLFVNFPAVLKPDVKPGVKTE